ncbi:hypothetical protein R84B8_02230 [Treponema sp. R8-4-B8]
MKKGLLFLCLVFICIMFLPAQQIDNLTRDAVNNLASRLNVLLEVSIGTITLDGTETPSEFSRLLAGKVNHYATNNDLFRVIAKSRSLSSTRPGGPPKGTISGNYTVTGDNVTVTLELVSDSNGVRLASQQFTLSLAELKKAGYEILPENIKSPQEAKEQEQIFTPPAAAVSTSSTNTPNNPALIIRAWPNSDTNTYIDGDELKINLESSQDCYFKVYHIDIDKKMQMIYPNAQNTNNFLKANNIRIIPEGNTRYNIESPFGQDTVLVVASTRQFANIEAEYVQIRSATRDVVLSVSRGLGVQTQQSGQPLETVTVSFNFTSLPGTYYDEIYTYAKPANMTEAIQSIRAEIQKQGGTFNGNEREGTFKVSGTEGVYNVSGNTVTVKLRYSGNQLGSRTRSAGYNFLIDKPKNINQALQSLRSGIESRGGTFSGNSQQGNFKVSGIAGQYSVADRITVSISEKPALIPNSMIEKEVRNYFVGK